MKTKKKSMPLFAKIFIALFAGIIFGYVLNFLGGVDNPTINDYILPFLQFLGDLFIRLIKMVVVPLVFFCIIDAALSLGDIKKLRSVGVKTIIWFLATGMIAAGIGLVFVNLIRPGEGLQLGTVTEEVTVSELPGVYETILDLFPENPFASLTEGDMMPIIVFALFMGFAIIAISAPAKPLANSISNLAQVMFKIVQVVIGIIPIGVFGLMSVTMARYGVAIFGPVLKFIITDYLTAIIDGNAVYEYAAVGDDAFEKL